MTTTKKRSKPQKTAALIARAMALAPHESARGTIIAICSLSMAMLAVADAIRTGRKSAEKAGVAS